MYISEKVFVMQFIAWLRKMGVREIPFDNAYFEKGADSMQAYFKKNRDQLGKYSNELAMLFLRNPLEGKYSEFKKAIGRQNGRLMSFDNPNYVHATIILDKEGVDYILRKDNIYISEKHIQQFCIAFCNGADIHIS
jgi:hypothetical protein